MRVSLHISESSTLKSSLAVKAITSMVLRAFEISLSKQLENIMEFIKIIFIYF